MATTKQERAELLVQWLLEAARKELEAEEQAAREHNALRESIEREHSRDLSDYVD